MSGGCLKDICRGEVEAGSAVVVRMCEGCLCFHKALSIMSGEKVRDHGGWQRVLYTGVTREWQGWIRWATVFKLWVGDEKTRVWVDTKGRQYRLAE